MAAIRQSLGRYCKAYLAKDLATLPGWRPRVDDLAPEVVEDEDGNEHTTARTALGMEDVLYLQDDYTVTDGIFRDEHVVFDAVDEDWKRAYEEELGFEIPAYCREDIVVDASDQYTTEELQDMERMEREEEDGK